MRKVVELVDRIEGEATLRFALTQNGEVAQVGIDFGLYRGIEEILRGKAPRDALVIAPRVCGICNHAHLLAAVEAIEAGLRAQGVRVELSAKARDIRAFTWACELMQNHFKWFYLTVLPMLRRLGGVAEGERDTVLKANFVSVALNKAAALFSGQWPHSSYAVPGGVTCDPTYVEVMQAARAVDEAAAFVEKVFLATDIAAFLEMRDVHTLSACGGDFGEAVRLLFQTEMAQAGKSYDRFLVLADSPLAAASKAIATKLAGVDTRYVREYDQPGSAAKGVRYKEKLYETGPLARAMVRKEPLIRDLHKRYKDATISRIVARMYEAVRLLSYAKTLLERLRVDEPSCTLQADIPLENFEGEGRIEAARGSLLHRTVVKEGCIAAYDIITPTQWNLSQGFGEEEGVAQKAMKGLRKEEAEFVFRSYDVCSVCTTQ